MTADPRLSSASQLASRLERLSADSYWAHQASGLRGSLLKCIERIEAIDRQNGARQVGFRQVGFRQVGLRQDDPGRDAKQLELEHLQCLTERGFRILARAAREIS